MTASCTTRASKRGCRVSARTFTCVRRRSPALADVPQHILAAADSTPDSITFTTQAELLLKLSHLDGEIFLVPKYSLDAKEPLSTGANGARVVPPLTLVAVTGLPANVRVHDPYTEVVMHPQHGPAPVPRIVEDAFHAQHALGVDVALDNDTSAAFDAARNAAAAFRGLPEQPGDNVRVITLGTSSAVSSMYRNGAALGLRPHSSRC